MSKDNELAHKVANLIHAEYIGVVGKFYHIVLIDGSLITLDIGDLNQLHSLLTRRR